MRRWITGAALVGIGWVIGLSHAVIGYEPADCEIECAIKRGRELNAEAARRRDHDRPCDSGPRGRDDRLGEPVPGDHGCDQVRSVSVPGWPTIYFDTNPAPGG